MQRFTVAFVFAPPAPIVLALPTPMPLTQPLPLTSVIEAGIDSRVRFALAPPVTVSDTLELGGSHKS